MGKAHDVKDVFMKFYPSAWRSEPKLRRCSLAARGLWLEFLCIAFDAHGYVRINGQVPSIRDIADDVRSTPREVTALIAELAANGVCQHDEDGAIYSPRLVRDLRRREAGRANGIKGGNPALSQTYKAVSDVPKDQIQRQKQNQIDQELGARAPRTVLMEFHLKNGRVWELSDAEVAGLRKAFPKVDVLQECQRANVWCEANPAKRKTAPGMSKFLFAWMARTSDRPSAGPRRGNTSIDTDKYAGLMEADDASL